MSKKEKVRPEFMLCLVIMLGFFTFMVLNMIGVWQVLTNPPPSNGGSAHPFDEWWFWLFLFNNG